MRKAFAIAVLTADILLLVTMFLSFLIYDYDNPKPVNWFNVWGWVIVTALLLVVNVIAVYKLSKNDSIRD